MSTFKNFVQCRVSTPITAAADSIGLYDAVPPYTLPSEEGGLLVLTDSPAKPSKLEVISYTSRSELGLYGVTRGLEGTTALEWTGPVYCYRSLLAGEFQTLLDSKVGKVTGKGLSDTNFTQAEKTKLTSVATDATKNRVDTLNADKVHTHTTAHITGLDTALADKSATTDPRFTDSREWTAATISQSEAETGTATTRRAWTAQSVRQAANSAIAAKNGIANGIASLDVNAKIPLSQLSDSIIGQVEYMGLWAASTNTPTLPTTPAEKGHYYVVSAAGTQFGHSFAVGDWAISNGTSWDKVDNTDAVSSVNGRTGNVTGLVESTDTSLTNSREWTAATISQAEAEAGTATTRRAFTAQSVRQAIVAWAPATATRWPTFAEVTGKPATYAPDAHTHPWAQVTGQPATATRWPTFDEVTGKPTNYPTTWASVAAKPAQATRWPTAAEAGAAPASHTHAYLPLAGGTATGVINATALGVSNTVATTGAGISLYGGTTTGQPSYGLMFAGPPTFGNHGSVTGDWATYFTMTGAVTRGWIFKNGTGATGNVASISGAGVVTAPSFVGALTGNATTATQLATARTIGGVSFNGTANINLPGVNAAGNQSTTGNAASATKLVTARTINGVNFDGTAAITITAAANGGTSAACSGNAASATKLATARTINGVSFNGSANITVADATKLPLAGGVISGTTASTSATTGSLQCRGGLGVSGNIYAGGNITAYSDIRLKKDIERIPDALEKVTQLNGVTYTRKDSGERHTGLIAQEVQKVLPEAVSGDEYLGVAYGNMVGLLIEAIKELKAEVDRLKVNHKDDA